MTKPYSLPFATVRLMPEEGVTSWKSANSIDLLAAVRPYGEKTEAARPMVIVAAAERIVKGRVMRSVSGALAEVAEVPSQRRVRLPPFRRTEAPPSGAAPLTDVVPPKRASSPA